MGVIKKSESSNLMLTREPMLTGKKLPTEELLFWKVVRH